MAPVLLTFLRINEHTGQLLVEPNALWSTQPKFWVGVHPAHPAALSPLLLSGLRILVASFLQCRIVCSLLFVVGPGM